jgi:hypothetical protein
VKFRACALVVGLSGLGMLRSVHAAEMPVDEGLLEFLGSVDSEDKDWHDYLAGTVIDQVARRARPAPVSPDATAPPSSSPPAAAPAPTAPPVKPP